MFNARNINPEAWERFFFFLFVTGWEQNTEMFNGRGSLKLISQCYHI